MDRQIMIAERLLETIAYGDSIGLPFEAKKYADMVKDNPKVSGLREITNKFMGPLPRGSWSDDTQLSLAVAESLIETGAFDLASQVTEHIKAWRQSTRGWGKSTTNSLERLAQGAHWSRTGNPNGLGNGVLMKMAPLALWLAARQDDNGRRHLVQFTRMTHDNAQSVTNTMVHLDILSGLAQQQISNPQIIPFAFERAQHYEDLYGCPDKTSQQLGALLAVKELSLEQVAVTNPGGGFHSSETLSMAYGVYSVEPNYPQTTYRAAELGGDADSIASITATLALFERPDMAPAYDSDELEAVERLRQVGQKLASVISRGK